MKKILALLPGICIFGAHVTLAQNSSTYKTLGFDQNPTCIFNSLKHSVDLSQPKIMGYTPYLWGSQFTKENNSGVIDATLPDGKKIMSFSVTSSNSGKSTVAVMLYEYTPSNLEIIESVISKVNSDLCK